MHQERALRASRFASRAGGLAGWLAAAPSARRIVPCETRLRETRVCVSLPISGEFVRVRAARLMCERETECAYVCVCVCTWLGAFGEGPIAKSMLCFVWNAYVRVLPVHGLWMGICLRETSWRDTRRNGVSFDGSHVRVCSLAWSQSRSSMYREACGRRG